MDSSKLKLFWPHPKVQWRGRGISEAWLEAMGAQGFEPEEDPAKADLAVFISDSQIVPDLIGKLPTICYFWGWEDERCLQPGFSDWAEPKVQQMGTCTRLLVPSLVSYYQACHFGLPAQVCFPGVDTKVLDQNPLRGADWGGQPQVVFISRLAPHKGLDVLIHAMSLITPQLTLVVIGPGDRAPYIEMARQLGVTATFLDAEDEQKVVELRRSSVLVHPSWYEGFSLPPMEALFCGVPVIASDIPQHRHLLQEDVAYFTSVEGLASTIADIISRPVPLDVLERTQRGQRRVRSNFTIEEAARRLWAHLHQIHKLHWATVLRSNPHDPEVVKRCYEAEHRRNWSYGMGDADVSAPMRFDPTWARHFRAAFFISELKAADCHRILDIGCGAIYPAIFARAGFDVTGVDVSEQAISQASQLASKWGVSTNVHLKQAWAQSLPFGDDQFDAVIHGEIWEHVPTIEPILLEAWRVLRPGGLLIASTPVGAHHFDPYHIGPNNGGWSEETIQKAIAHWRGQCVKLEAIAEAGAEPSCYLIVLRKETNGGRQAMDWEGREDAPETVSGPPDD